MSSTPTSDYITKLIDSAPDALVSEFYESFLTSNFGLIMQNLPAMQSGESFTISDDSVTTELVTDPEGNSLIKVCADPEVFEEKYKAGINALMSGKKVLEMLLKTNNTKGILICSAASFHSYPIYIETANKILNNVYEEIDLKKWWQFWK